MSESQQHPSDDPVEHVRQAWHELWSSEPFLIVLALVFATFVFLESAPDKEWASIVVVVLQGGTLLLCLRAAQFATRYVRAAAVVVVIALLTSVLAVVGVGEEISVAFVRLVSVALVALAPVAIARSVMRSIFSQKRVTLQAIFGVIAIYLLLGMVFAYTYAAIGALGGGEFFSSGAAENIQNFTYFSYVTLTTVGYGDLTAAHQFGRTVAIVEALSGQLYLITVLSMFVSNLRPRSQQ